MPSRSFALPPLLLDALNEVGATLERGSKLGSELKTALDLLGKLPPNQIAQADGAIAAAAHLYQRQPQSIWRGLFSYVPSYSEQLLRTSGLEYIFLFHRDGRLREKALIKITGGLPNPFFFAAILWRLNDWAAPVREAAVHCASRSFPITSPTVVARVAAAMLVQQGTWGRWREERAILDRVLARDDVAADLAELICRDTTGPLASILRYALRTPALDSYLEQIAFEAVQPSVRAAALITLVNAEAEWPSGFAWQWIDKSMGVRHRVTKFDHRILPVILPKEGLIARGIEDRSAVVRGVALTAAYYHLPKPLAKKHAAVLIADRSPTVRNRAQFILRSETT